MMKNELGRSGDLPISSNERSFDKTKSKGRHKRIATVLTFCILGLEKARLPLRQNRRGLRGKDLVLETSGTCYLTLLSNSGSIVYRGGEEGDKDSS